MGNEMIGLFTLQSSLSVGSGIILILTGYPLIGIANIIVGFLGVVIIISLISGNKTK